MGRVEGKIALITGGASGLGLADAKALAAEGATVIISDVNAENGKKAAAEIGDKALFMQHDVSSEQAWIDVCAAIDKEFGTLDILVNNAGIVMMASPEECTLEDFRRASSIMTDGVFLGMKHCLPLLKKGTGGSIINMSSTASHLGYPIFFAYTACKGAVRSMTKAMAVHCQLTEAPVRCNSVHPAGIETPMIQTAEGRLDKPAHEIPSGVLPFGQLGAPEDVASMIVYLASDESRFITGAEFLIDNGLFSRPSNI